MTLPLHFSVAYDSTAPWPEAQSLVEPLLSVCRIQTRSEGAYVYVPDPYERRLNLTAWNGLSPSAAERFEAELDAEAATWWSQLSAPGGVSRAAWQDRRFRSFPEFVRHQFESALAVPLQAASGLVGAVNFCRRDAIPYADAEIAFAASIKRSLGELVARTSVYTRSRKLETELDQVKRKLADRKLIDRAKGILQEKFGVTEEEAYFRLRRASRRRREPMASIARFLIENQVLPDLEENHAS
jgi:signal transduction protein with GAF and PtsI domain